MNGTTIGGFTMKRILSATLIFLLAFSSVGYAHTGLTNSSPTDGEEVTEDVEQLVLEFNTKIETTSTVKVFNESEEEMTINDTQVRDSVMTAVFPSPLDNGTYTVDWKVIGADGHPTQGTYSFEVIQEEIEEIAAPVEPVETEEIPAEPVEESVEEPVEQVIEDSSKIASNDVLVVILVILFTLAGGFIGWIIGRRQK